MDPQAEIMKDLKPIGKLLFNTQAKHGITCLDVWVSSEPGVIVAQYFDKNYKSHMGRIDCNEKEKMELEGWD